MNVVCLLETSRFFRLSIFESETLFYIVETCIIDKLSYQMFRFFVIQILTTLLKVSDK